MKVSLGSIAQLAEAEDKKDQIHWESDGTVSFHTNNQYFQYPKARTQNVSAQLQHTTTAVLVLAGNGTGNPWYGRLFELAEENTAKKGTSTYRRYGVLIRDGSMYRKQCTPGCTETLLGAVADNTTYTVTITTSSLTARLEVQAQGSSAWWVHAMNMDWVAGVAGMNKRLVSGNPDGITARAIDAPVVMKSLDQITVAPQNGSIVAATTRHGYTGHEMLDNVQLVHMNGRLYDPVVGRMLSADPTVPGDADLQAYNRYTYVMNSPLSFVDPSGFTPEGGGFFSSLLSFLGMGGSSGNAGSAKIDVAGQQPGVYGQPANFGSPQSGNNDRSEANAKNSGVMSQADQDELYGGESPRARMKSATNAVVKPVSEAAVATLNAVNPVAPQNVAALGLFSLAGKFWKVLKAALPAESVVASPAGKGGLNLFKWGKDTTTKAGGWKEGDFMLHLPNKGSPAANWEQNSSRLRAEMGKGNPIYDSYRNPATGERIPTDGFLRAERNLLESRGWQYNQSTGAYHPPSN